MKRFNTLIYLFIFLISVTTKHGQSATLKGVVSDSLSGNTLIGANVFISGTSLGAATDDEGAFIIKNITPGSYNIKVSYIGYKSVEAEFDLSEPKTYEQNFHPLQNVECKVPLRTRTYEPSSTRAEVQNGLFQQRYVNKNLAKK